MPDLEVIAASCLSRFGKTTSREQKDVQKQITKIMAEHSPAETLQFGAV